ncbi:MAG: hypothetical protein ACRDGO_11275 [Actinomycetota bacterium]
MSGKIVCASALAVLAVVVFGVGGLIVGAFIGNLIAPARLDWSAQSTPGLLFVGAILGFVGGVSGGIWAGVRMVRDAKDR